MVFSSNLESELMKQMSLLVLAALYNVAAMAQDGGATSVDVNLKGDSGGGFSWVWIVGIIVFVVLLIALLGRGGTDRVVEKRTTVIKD